MNIHVTRRGTGDTTARRRGSGSEGILALQTAGITDRGLERPENEDRYLVASLSPARGQLLAVADGVGGAAGGAIASTLTVTNIDRHALPTLAALAARNAAPEELANGLYAAYVDADQRLLQEIQRRPSLKGMATTLTLALSFGRRLVVANVGDGRCYLLRGGAMRLVTSDQTVAAEMSRLGLIPPEAVADHPLRHVLAYFVGGGPSKLRVDVAEHELRDGDIVLVASDGLTDMVPESAIRRLILEYEDPARACERLVIAANEQGGRDNITAIVARAVLAD